MGLSAGSWLDRWPEALSRGPLSDTLVIPLDLVVHVGAAGRYGARRTRWQTLTDAETS
jgi:hypothetical protein